MNLGDKIKYKRMQLGITQEDIAKKLNLNKSTIQRYETNKVKVIKLPIIEAIATYLNVNPSWLIGKSEDEQISEKSSQDIFSIPNIIPIPKMKKVPLVGTIACGTPTLAEENIIDYLQMPDDYKGDFALTCKGDSMINARIFDGDIVFIRQQEMVENGEIAAVLVDEIDGGHATLKRVYLYKNRIELRAENPTFKTMEFEEEEMNRVKILGKAVAFASIVR